MKKIFSVKNVLFALTGGLVGLVLIITTIIAIFDDDDYRWLLIKLVDVSSDYRLEISGPFHFNLSAVPDLSVKGIELFSKTGENHISLQAFELQFMLEPLLDGTLLIERVLVTKLVANLTDPSQGDGGPSFTPGYFFPALVLKSAAITNVVVNVGEENQSYTLLHLNIDDINDQGPLLVDANGFINKQQFSIRGHLGSLQKLLTEKQYPVDIKLSTPSFSASLQGEITDVLHANGLDLQFNLEVADLKKLIGPNFPDLIRVNGIGRLRGDLYQPEITGLDLTLIRDDRIKVTATGAIADILASSGINISFNGVIADPDLTALLLPASMPQFNDIRFDARLIDFEDTIRLVDIDARLSDPLGLKTTLEGNIDFNPDTTHFIQAMSINATLDAATTVAARPFLVDVIPEMGPVIGKAKIKSHDTNLVIEDIDLIIGIGQPVNLQITGNIGNVPLSPDVPNSDITLDLVLNADQASFIGTLLQHDLPDIGPVTINTRYTRGTKHGRFNNLQLTAGDLKSLSTMAEGYIQLLYNNKASVSLGSSLIKIRAESTSLRKVSKLLGFDLPNLGPVMASMVVNGEGSDFSGRDINIRIGRKRSLLLDLAGSIAKLPLTGDQGAGIDLRAVVKAPSTKALSVLANGGDIPDIGPLSGQFNIKGNFGSVSVEAIKFDAGSQKKLTASVRGNIEQLALGNSPFKGVKINLAAAAPTTSVLSELVGKEVIDMGALTFTGQVDSEGNLLQVKKLEILVGSRAAPALLISGSVNNLLEGKGIEINIPFSEQFVHQFLAKKPKNPVPLNGHILLSDADGRFGVKSLSLETEQTNIIDIKLKGGIDDIMQGNEINIDAYISIQDLERLGRAFNMDLPALGEIDLQGKLVGNREHASFDGIFKFNETEVTSKLKVLNFDKQPVVKGSISMPVLHLQDFGIKAEVQSPNQRAQPKKQHKDHYFSRTPISFDALYSVDLDIKVDIDEVEGTEFVLDSVDMDIKLNNGVLDIDSANFKYADGQVKAHASVDANKPPRLKLSLSGDDVNLKGLLLQTQIPTPIEGTMDLAVELSSIGSSAHEIAANLDGDFGITLGNGMIRRRQIDFLFLDFVDWLFTFGISKNETKINCAIVRYKINKGIMDTEVFYLDGPKIIARGEGTVDLGAEKIDVVVNLEKKRLLMNSRTPIHILGTLSDPSVLPIPYKQALLTVGGYIFAPFITIPAEALGAVGNLLYEPGSEGSCRDRVATPKKSNWFY